jgi:hypothetical protein
MLGPGSSVVACGSRLSAFELEMLEQNHNFTQPGIMRTLCKFQSSANHADVALEIKRHGNDEKGIWIGISVYKAGSKSEI